MDEDGPDGETPHERSPAAAPVAAVQRPEGAHRPVGATVGDLLIWDHFGTMHRAIADYGPDEIRLIHRCQVMATKVFDPAFLQPALELQTAGVA